MMWSACYNCNNIIGLLLPPMLIADIRAIFCHRSRSHAKITILRWSNQYGDVMSTTENLEERFLDACEEGELQTIREFVQRKAVDPNRIVEKRDHYCRTHRSWSTKGCTPLHYASM